MQVFISLIILGFRSLFFRRQAWNLHPYRRYRGQNFGQEQSKLKNWIFRTGPPCPLYLASVKSFHTFTLLFNWFTEQRIDYKKQLWNTSKNLYHRRMPNKRNVGINSYLLQNYISALYSTIINSYKGFRNVCKSYLPHMFYDQKAIIIFDTWPEIVDVYKIR